MESKEANPCASSPGSRPATNIEEKEIVARFAALVAEKVKESELDMDMVKWFLCNGEQIGKALKRGFGVVFRGQRMRGDQLQLF